MQFIVNSRGKMDLTPDVREYVEEKIGKMANVFGKIISVRVELSREEKRDDGKTFACEVLVSVPGQQFRVDRQRGEELFEAIDLAEEALESQIKTFKGKMIDESRQNQGTPPPLPPEDEPEMEYEYTSEIGQEPMSLEEAKKQMELLGHDFYVFTNVNTGQTNTVYKKANGRFGVIVEKK